MAEIPRKERAAIKSDIALSRERFGRELGGLRYELDFKEKLRRSFRTHPVIWIGALILVGVVLAVAPARTKKIYVQPKFKGKRGKGEGLLEAGALMGAARFAATLLKPVIVSLVASKMRGYAKGSGSKPR